MIVLVATVLMSCDKNRVYEEYRDIPGKVWENKEPVLFNVEVNDTVTPSNLIVHIRHTNEYQFQNLFLFFTTIYPDGEMSRDTLEFYLLNDRGKPLGSCSGDICNAKFMIRKGVKFPQKGKYVFGIEQNMRTGEQKLQHITDIGLRIEKATKP